MNGTSDGLLIKSIGGFYEVEAADAVYTCRARGIFRKEGRTPLVGDRVRITVQADGSGSLDELLPRRNALVRPPVANLDKLVVVAATADPAPSTLILDKLIALAEHQGIEPVIVINKSDLEDAGWLQSIYRQAGLSVFLLSAREDSEEIGALAASLAGEITAFTGNTGVGKSSLLNRIDPRLALETGETSRKLGRGRHTTRSCALYKLPGGGYVADTPGFSSLDMVRANRIPKDELVLCFREFAPFLGRCRYTSCTHVRETDCAIRTAVEAGAIARSRYDSFTAMYEEVKDIPDWEQPKNLP